MSGELFINDDLIVEIALNPVPGSSSGDGLINVLDMITTSNYFIGISPNEFCFFNRCN